MISENLTQRYKRTAKVLNVSLASALKYLITMLITCLCDARNACGDK